MWKLIRTAGAVFFGIVLAGCMGTQAPTISGLAATGAALGNASILAKCASGSASGSTAADGSFTLPLNNGQVAPCLLQVTKGSTTLHSFAATTGYVNVTPITDLVVAKALGSDATTAFTGFNATTATTINSGLVAAKAYVKAEITAITGSAQSGDPMTGVFKVGDADDRVLDTLNTKLATAGRGFDDLRRGAVLGAAGAISASLDRGQLIDAISTSSVIYTYTAAAIDAGPLKALTGTAKCDVKVVPLNYKTIGVSGENTNASGVLLLPTGSNCTAAAGLVAYAKGTDVKKLRTLADPTDGETFLLAAFYAAQGYAVVATDYLGFAKSQYSFHPYLHADSEASSVIDAIRAARRAASTLGSPLSGKVMLTGYSQGGHSSMAAHRAIERDNASEINVVAGAHLAGPYNMSGSLKSEAVIAGYQFFVPYLITAWQKVYGNVYTSASEVFKAPYSGHIESLLPSAVYDYTTLITSGKLPYGPSPTQARDAMFNTSYLTDSRANENSGLLAASKKNDLLGWNPKSKLMLCGGAGDPTVPPALHQAPMKADFDSRNLTNVTTVDVDAQVQYFYGVNGAAPTDPSSDAFSTYYGNYHGSYEPPFCHARAKAMFDLAIAN
jgi:pimeloyl-ACP methyl ester carboxylesterase